MNVTSPQSALEEQLRRLIPDIGDQQISEWPVDLFDPTSLAAQSRPVLPSSC